MQEAPDKRNVPQGLKALLAKDIEWTNYFIQSTQHLTLFRSLKIHHKLLEFSCNGIIWLVVCLGSIWFLGVPSLFQLQANLLLALIFDIIVIAFLKAYVRRRRPAAAANDSTIGPDKFSFPSGHASRSVFLLYIFLFIDPVPLIFAPPILAWTVTVCMSRIISERHYILDVAAGFVIGIAEGIFFSLMWLSADSALYLIDYISDEKAFGGDYHV